MFTLVGVTIATRNLPAVNTAICITMCRRWGYVFTLAMHHFKVQGYTIDLAPTRYHLIELLSAQASKDERVDRPSRVPIDQDLLCSSADNLRCSAVLFLEDSLKNVDSIAASFHLLQDRVHPQLLVSP